MNVPHSANPKPSWYGESVGHYEGDTLVVDTVGFNDKTFVDSYRTPHTDKLHVVERFRLIDGGNTLEVAFTVDDPGTFYQPWSGTRNRHRVTRNTQPNSTARNRMTIITTSALNRSRPRRRRISETHEAKAHRLARRACKPLAVPPPLIARYAGGSSPPLRSYRMHAFLCRRLTLRVEGNESDGAILPCEA